MEDHEQASEESYSIDIDSDRDLAEELLTIDAEFEGSMLGGSHDWHDDVMTEGELGELLRATAAAVIAGEIGPEESTPPPGFAQAETPVAGQIGGRGDTGGSPCRGRRAGCFRTDRQTCWRRPRSRRRVERPVSRATEELPLLVAYQIEHDRVGSQPSSDEVPPASEPEEIAAEAQETDVEVVPESPAPVPIEPVAVLAAEPTGSANEPSSSESVQPEASAAPEAVDGDDGESRRVERKPKKIERRPVLLWPLRLETTTKTWRLPDRPRSCCRSRGSRRREGGGEARVPVATTLQRLLRLAAARGAGTVYVVANSAPLVRVDGEFSTLEGEPALSAAFVDRLLSEVAPSARGESPSAEWLIDVPEIGRVRCVAFRDHRGPGVIFRMVPARAISADQLGLSAEVQALCSEADGLILVTGGRGSGKSTLLTSFVDLINRTRSDHIITTESQIDFVHEHKRSFISQREVRGEDAMVSAVRAACREEPDVLIVEDIRTPGARGAGAGSRGIGPTRVRVGPGPFDALPRSNG